VTTSLGDTNGAPHLRGEPGDLTSEQYGPDRARTTANAEAVTAIARQESDPTGNVMWAGTTTGRVFITMNAAAPAPAVTFTRIDDKAANDPPRFVSNIVVDPANPNHAWISYGGYNGTVVGGADPNVPGHVFDVTWSGTAAVWRDLHVETGNGDYPINDIVRDDTNGNLYAATDFGVLVGVPSGANYVWSQTPGLPRAEVSGLRIHSAQRVLYAATHGRSVYRMILP